MTCKAAAAVTGALAATGSFMFQAGMMTIAFFFLLVDGARLVRWLEAVSPLEEGQTTELLIEFRKVTGAVLIVTLTAFNAYGFIGSRMADLWRARSPARQHKDEPSDSLTAMVRNVKVQADGPGRPFPAQIVHPPRLGDPG